MGITTSPQLSRNELWWRSQYHGIKDHSHGVYALRMRYHPMWEPSWEDTRDGSLSAEDGKPSIVCTPLSALSMLTDDIM